MPAKIIELTGQVNIFVKEQTDRLRRILIHPTARREKSIAGQNRFDLYAKKGEALYCLQCLSFLQRLGIADDPNRSLYCFNSRVYMADFIERVGVLRLLSVSPAYMEKLGEKEKGNISKAVFYVLVALADEADKQKVMDCLTMRYYSYLLNKFLFSHRSITINYKAMVEGLLKSDFPKLVKESFGENTEGAYFKLHFKKQLVYEETGNSIKTMRKKGYKELLFHIID
ncbi:MAG: hypothetical protein LLG40_05445 [Deltaproteobacteria bacterium]|nr:hypothetical protein [Deltaproteobacteria bacterium]